MPEFTFTISATFEADNQQDAWDEWVEWLTEPMHVEDGTEVTNNLTLCGYCGMALHRDRGVWVDDTEGDVCSGDDNLVNENEQHVPSPVKLNLIAEAQAKLGANVIILTDDDDDGTSGQDRESYTDDQDRDSYTVTDDEDEQTYKIVRFYEDGTDTEVIDTGLTLDEAQAHCKDPDTRGTTDEGVRWFDGYEAE